MQRHVAILPSLTTAMLALAVTIATGFAQDGPTPKPNSPEPKAAETAPPVSDSATAAVPDPTAPATEAPPTAQVDLTVTGKREPGTPAPIRAELPMGPAADSAQAVKATPGASVHGNGPLGGQIEYRGMTGPRVNTRVDNGTISPGCLNWMDPPLHYLPGVLLESLEMERGIAPVSSGLETIGGTARAKTKTSRFTESEAFEFHGDVESASQTADDSYLGGGMISFANQFHRMHLVGSYDDIDDLEFDGGTVNPSQAERATFGGGYGVRLGDHSFGVDYRRTNTDSSGTPTLPMDIAYFHTDQYRFEYEGTVGEVGLDASLNYDTITHRMDNYSLRPATMRHRYADSESSTLGWKAAAKVLLLGGVVQAGTDGNRTHHDGAIYDPFAPTFFVRNFHDVERNLVGVFAEWEGELHPAWRLHLGARWTHAALEAGDAEQAASQPAPAKTLAANFNAADRTLHFDDFDWVTKLAWQVRDDVVLEVSGARKSRAPHYTEVFAWSPSEGTSGLADGNNYVGSLALDAEVAHEVDLRVEWQTERFHLAPRTFYRFVDDFIQGVAFDATPGLLNTPTEVVSAMGGDATPLRFANVEAEFWGVEADWGVHVDDHWHLNGLVSWVRGQRADVDDDLYLIPPLNGRVDLSYRDASWSVTLQNEWSARQRQISREIVGNESRVDHDDVPGFALVHLVGEWEVWKGVTLSAGVRNLFDQEYEDPLSGFNRVQSSDADLLERLPGAGRSAFVGVHAKF